MPYRQTRRPLPALRLGILCSVGCLIVACLLWWAATRNAQPAGHRLPLPANSGAPSVDADTDTEIAAFCGDCHAMPRPESFTRDQWHDEVRLGYEAYARSGRTDLAPPPIQDTVAYYRSRAPAQLVFPSAEEVNIRLKSSFTLEPLDWGQDNYVLPAVSYLRWGSIGLGDGPRLLTCDMRDGSVSALDLRGSTRHRVVLAQFDHPCRVEPCDLDGDGWIDLVVAELGSFYPTDHDRGRVVWLRRNGPDESFTPVTLAEKLGRVADVRPTDVDGDGDQDLIVAEFGHFDTGKIALLQNVAESGMPQFNLRQLDPRPGTIHVPIHDFNTDGRPDFLALVSQESECLDLFLNQGNGSFRRHNLWAGPDLTFGSSGIELVDLDQDGDMDVLYTNGDAFDNSCASPTHGIQWLENLGDVRFAYRRLVDFPGAYRALPADFDQDGDLDVIAVAFLGPTVTPESLRSPAVASILVLEQVSPGDFRSHTLEAGLPNHATFEVGDFDADGDVDFVVGTNLFPHGVTAGEPTPARLTVWWNERNTR
jgi:FG-GAP-like repeat